MSLSFQRIGLFIRKDDPIMEKAVTKVTQFLHHHVKHIVINEPLAFLPSLKVISISDFVEQCDLTIAVGGDGTILSASRALAGSGLPLVGINVGRLGFLADVTIDDIQEELSEILHGYYREDTRYLMQATLNNADNILGCAMNDVVVHASHHLHMIEFETAINGRFLNSQRADGIVVATPTGSTAYAMSAGGPILDIDIDALVLASVCPHTLSNRPLVIAADSVIEITLSEKNPSHCLATCDGRPGYILNPGDTIRIERYPKTITLLHLEGHDHYSILRAKLEWGRQLT
ncbi:MAG TPA: NAD(+) kinase [Gammaproteobacteria bacterium]|nr:NAD(+) kinase [Gammaproteobacteria bacterium]